MVNNKKTTKSKNQTKVLVPKKKKTPFGDAGEIAARGIGNFFKIGDWSHVGRWLGTGIGSIFGSGDYTAIGPNPGYNVFSGQIPKFSTTRATNIVCHREYLFDVAGASAFQNQQLPLNPGMATTFPWLSQVAANYQQYKFHGLIIEFRPLVTDFVTSGAPGVICITSNYNSDQPAYTSRIEAENAEFAVSTKPTQSLVHMLECNPEQVANKLYNVRTGPVPVGQDLRLYDLALSQIITQGNPTQSLGEVWISYCVEFFKPVLALEYGITPAVGLHLYRSGFSSGAPLGSATVTSSGSSGITFVITGNNILTLSGLIVGTTYMVSLNATGQTSGVFGITAASGFAARNLFVGGSINNVLTPSGAPCALTLTDVATATSASLTFGATVSGTGSVDIFVQSLDAAINV